MSPFVENINVLLSAATVVGQALVVLLAALAVRGKNDNYISHFAERQGIVLAFIIALASTLGSFFYSNVAGFLPCVLCWYQRIALFPQVIVLGFGAYGKDEGAARSSIALSAIGALIAAYNSYIQFGGSPLTPCGAAAGEVSCTVRYFIEFNYVTIPIMSLTAFGLIISVLILQKRMRRAKTDTRETA